MAEISNWSCNECKHTWYWAYTPEVPECPKCGCRCLLRVTLEQPAGPAPIKPRYRKELYLADGPLNELTVEMVARVLEVALPLPEKPKVEEIKEPVCSGMAQVRPPPGPPDRAPRVLPTIPPHRHCQHCGVVTGASEAYCTACYTLSLHRSER